MRETLAKLIAAAITGLLVLMAALFADGQNEAEGAPTPAAVEPPRPDAPALPSPDPIPVARGRDVYDEQGCSRCHAVRGVGNPRVPLDGVGARRPVAELRDWVTAEGAAGTVLSRSTQRVKAAYRELPEDDLQALAAYLSSLR